MTMSSVKRFLFQGDSITDGGRGRTEDPNHILGHSYAFLIGSRLAADFPELGLEFINRGVGGESHVEVAARWQEDTLNLHPDVLSILIGVNGSRQACGIPRPWDNKPDCGNRQSPEVYEETLRKIIGEAKEQNPELLLVLCLPFRFPSASFTEEENAMIVAMVQKRAGFIRKLAAEFNAVLVDFPGALERAIRRKGPAEYWSWDGVHVTFAGSEILAREWMRTVAPHVPFLKGYKYSNGGFTEDEEV